MALTSERFELGARIGRGSAGEVHRALDTFTGATVAVKLVDLEEAEDEVEDIQKEISYLAQCSSEYVTKYLGSWLCEGSTRLAIAMGRVGYHFSPRYFAVKTPVDNSPYFHVTNLTPPGSWHFFHVILQSSTS
jgi:serine/threonine protein kinase